MKVYQKIIDDFNKIANTTPQKGGALCICTENNVGAVMKHGSTKEIIEAIAAIAAQDERIYYILSNALHLACVCKVTH